MPETLDDILEELADKLWIYGEKRNAWIIEMRERIDRVKVLEIVEVIDKVRKFKEELREIMEEVTP